MHIPSNAVNELDGHKARMLPVGDMANFSHPVVQNFLADYDVIIVQRNLFTPDVWRACDYWRALGKVVCADLDDDYPRLTPQNPAFPFWNTDVRGVEGHFGHTPIKGLEEGLRHCDYLISPSRLILEDWKDVVEGIYVPNWCYAPWYEGVEQKPLDPDRVVVGWGGSVSHFDSWWFGGVMGAAEMLFEAYPQAVIKICGNDWRLLNLLADEWPADRWIHQNGVPPQEWPKQVASFDVGLAPLCGPRSPQSHEYDKRRSWLKAVEYLMCGVPWVGSPGPVYADLAGTGGVLAEDYTGEAWFEAIAGIIDNIEAKKAESRELMAWARESLTMQANAEDYVKTLVKLVKVNKAVKGPKLADVVYIADVSDPKKEEENGEQAGS